MERAPATIESWADASKGGQIKSSGHRLVPVDHFGLRNGRQAHESIVALHFTTLQRSSLQSLIVRTRHHACQSPNQSPAHCRHAQMHSIDSNGILQTPGGVVGSVLGTQMRNFTIERQLRPPLGQPMLQHPVLNSQGCIEPYTSRIPLVHLIQERSQFQYHDVLNASIDGWFPVPTEVAQQLAFFKQVTPRFVVIHIVDERQTENDESLGAKKLV